MRSRRSGFTLIEIVVTISIMVIMAGLIVPTLPDVTASRLKSTARKLAGVISYTYDRAASMGLTLRLTFDLAENEYYLSVLNTDHQFEETELDFARRTSFTEGTGVVQMITGSKGVVREGNGYIHFLPGGYVERTVLYLADDAGNQLSLFVHPLTGKVSIKEGFVDEPEE